MKIPAAIIISLLVLAGCSKKEEPRVSSATTEADNSGRNVRDRNDATKTPGDQAENEADRTITQNIRQAIVGDDSLSTNGKNVKIITADGNVTLRGPVASEKEKSTIAAKAQQIAGVKQVDNQLEVATN